MPTVSSRADVVRFVVGIAPTYWQHRPTLEHVVDLGGTLDEPVAPAPSRPAPERRTLRSSGGGQA